MLFASRQQHDGRGDEASGLDGLPARYSIESPELLAAAATGDQPPKLNRSHARIFLRLM